MGALDVADRRQIDQLLSVKSEGDTLRSDPTKVNKLGSLLSKVPLSPKFSKMLVVALKYGLAHFTIMMVACMSVAEIYQEVQQNASHPTGQDADNANVDPDLLTSIDVERGEKKKRRMEKQAYHNNLHMQKEVRGKWQSAKSDCLEYVHLMVDYFNHLN